MRIHYQFEGQPETLTYTFGNGKWSGGHLGYSDLLNHKFVETVGKCILHPWYKVLRVAAVLGGTLATRWPV